MKKLWKTALLLSIITVVYNLLEGLISLYFGVKDETLALSGFGVDSFVEVISGIGILHLTVRLISGKEENRDRFEKIALKITGFAFYLLAIGLLFSAGISLYQKNQPETTLAGLIISAISLLTMYSLMYYKKKVGLALNSKAILADANCTKTCILLSAILFISSFLFQITGWGYFDILGSLGIAYYAFKEGKEAFKNAKTEQFCCHCHKD